MDPIQRLAIESACTRLVLDAADLTDRQDYAGLAGLFLADGVLHRPTTPDAPLVGRDAIFAAYQTRPAHRITRHLCTNLRVTVESETRARVHCYVHVVAADSRQDAGNHFGPPLEGRVMIGEFDDLCVFENGRWYFAGRRASFVMHQSIAD